MKNHKGEMLLLLASVIWGSAYIFQKVGMDYVGPFTFGFCRFCLGALALVPVVWLFDRRRQRLEGPAETAGAAETGAGTGARTPRPGAAALTDRTLLVGSLLCGLTQFAAGSLQQIGLIYTTAGKAGFITSMHIVIVPVLMIFLRRRVGFITWIGVALAVFGMYLLCITEGFRLHLGDGLVFGCAVVYALQILLIDYYAVRTDPIRLAALQFLIAGILSGICMLLFEHVVLAAILACAVPILYTGLLEVAAAYTLEIFGQQTTAPSVTAIILSLESVFAVICGALFLGEQLSSREIIGCVLMMSAFLIAQIGGGNREKTD
ncbi:MAG: DMT family transporter [Firmicutes bacterium]|nr:DMT family transporter [Bacillota bacterium]